MKKFYSYTCSIYSHGTSKVRGSLVQTKILKYENIKCALWKSRHNYSQTTQAIQTNNNTYEINLDSAYSQINIWDIITISWIDYMIDNFILHHKSNWKLDNIQIFASITTK